MRAQASQQTDWVSCAGALTGLRRVPPCLLPSPLQRWVGMPEYTVFTAQLANVSEQVAVPFLSNGSMLAPAACCTLRCPEVWRAAQPQKSDAAVACAALLPAAALPPAIAYCTPSCAGRGGWAVPLPAPVGHPLLMVARRHQCRPSGGGELAFICEKLRQAVCTHRQLVFTACTGVQPNALVWWPSPQPCCCAAQTHDLRTAPPARQLTNDRSVLVACCALCFRCYTVLPTPYCLSPFMPASSPTTAAAASTCRSPSAATCR